MSTSHLYVYAQVITLNFLYCSQWALLSSTENKIKFLPAEKDATSWVFGILGWQSYRMQEALLHKFLLFPAALVFLSVGIRKAVQMYRDTALAITGVVMPIPLIGLWRSAMTPVFLSCQGQKNASSDLCLVFFFFFFVNLSCQRLNFHGFVLVVKIWLNLSVPYIFI